MPRRCDSDYCLRPTQTDRRLREERVATLIPDGRPPAHPQTHFGEPGRSCRRSDPGYEDGIKCRMDLATRSLRLSGASPSYPKPA